MQRQDRPSDNLAPTRYELCNASIQQTELEQEMAYGRPVFELICYVTMNLDVLSYNKK
jgi:hypothetical protein